jgi:hypothetical protein
MANGGDSRMDSQTLEVAGLFETRDAFDGAVAALLAAGVPRSGISVLASHAPLDAAEARKRPPRDNALMALTGELTYLFPLTTAGLLAVVGGPITAELAALVAAGVGGLAVKDYIGEVTSHPETREFARALEDGGVIVWVRAADESTAGAIVQVLEQSSGKNVHLVARDT